MLGGRAPGNWRRIPSSRACGLTYSGELETSGGGDVLDDAGWMDGRSYLVFDEVTLVSALSLAREGRGVRTTDVGVQGTVVGASPGDGD